MKTYVEQSKIDKKLCLHCKYFTEYSDKKMCGLYRSKVDDSELYTAIENRYNNRCGGRKWVLKDEIVICKDGEATFLNSEDWIDSFMPLARKILTGESERGMMTCGGLEKALERAKLELSK